MLVQVQVQVFESRVKVRVPMLPKLKVTSEFQVLKMSRVKLEML